MNKNGANVSPWPEHACSALKLIRFSFCSKNNSGSSVGVHRYNGHKQPRRNSICLQDLEHFVSLDRIKRLSEVQECYNCREFVLSHILKDAT